MSWLRDLEDPVERGNRLDALRPMTAERIEELQSATAFEGAAGELLRGPARFAASAVKAVGIAGAAPLALAELAIGEPGRWTDEYFRQQVEPWERVVESLRPNPRTVGAVGQVLGEVAGMVTLVPLPAVLIGEQTIGPAAELTEAGASAPAAVAAGLAQGASAVLGFHLPAAFGKTLAQRLATGAAANTALGVVTRGAQAGILLADDQAALAAHYAPSWTYASIDALMGLAFGGIAHMGARGAPRLTPAQTQALLAANNARHYQDGTMPGRAASIGTAQAHVEAMDTALQQVAQGRPVDVGRLPERMDFAPDPARERIRAEVEAVAREELQLGEAYDRVLRDPVGPENDPLVLIQPEDIEAVAVMRGGWKGLGDIEIKGKGLGLVKFIWRHGEKSKKPPEFQIERDDVLAFPRVIREVEPTQHVNDRGESYREWRVDRPYKDSTRTVVYVDKGLVEGQARPLISIYVQEPGKAGHELPLSKKLADRKPESPGKRFDARTGDTPPAFLQQTGRERPTEASIPPSASAPQAAPGEAAVSAREQVTQATAPLPIDQQAAMQALAQRPGLMVVDESTGQEVRAADLLARADEEMTQAAEQTTAVQAAVACFLRG